MAGFPERQHFPHVRPDDLGLRIDVQAGPGRCRSAQKKATGRLRTNQSHGWDSYGCGVLRPTPNWSICLWYSYSE